MKSIYQQLEWLKSRWSEETLANWPWDDIEKRDGEVHDAIRHNQGVYEAAKAERRAARNEFHAAHPRTKLPNSLLEGPEKPPDLMKRWSYLLSRRRKAKRRAEKQAVAHQEYIDKKQRLATRKCAEKREVFVDRMKTGRLSAAIRRETTIKRLINEVARQRGITLNGRASDEMLMALLNALGLLPESAQHNEPAADA